MAPVAYGMLVLIAGIVVVAVLVGSAGGAIHGRIKGELSLGAILVAGAYFLVVVFLQSWSSGRIALFGLLPLILTFLVGSSTTRLLEERAGVRPAFAILAGLGGGLCVGLAYLMSIRVGWLKLTDPRTAWIGLAVMALLGFLSIRKWMARKGAGVTPRAPLIPGG